MATFNSYLAGFIISVALTLAAYFAVTLHSSGVLWVIFGAAIVQLFVQLIFFLHIGKGPDARWTWLFFSFASLVVVIIVGGSLWIMANLNYNMTSAQMNASMLDQAE